MLSVKFTNIICTMHEYAWVNDEYRICNVIKILNKKFFKYCTRIIQSILSNMQCLQVQIKFLFFLGKIFGKI